MKKWISLFMAMTLLLGLCACSGKTGALVDKESLAAAFASAVSSVGTEESTSAASEPDLTTGGEPADTYVTVEETETAYGRISIPQLDEAKLGSEDVRLANAMFRSILDWVLERVEDCKREWGDESYHDAAEPLCVTRYTLNGSLLSVTVKYLALYPYSILAEFNEAVNIDISTGKALDHHQVIGAAGFTEDEVMAALRCYAERFMFYEWERYMFYAMAEEGTLPDGLGDPSYGWQEELDEIAVGYDAPVLAQGEPWDTLPHYPTVYAGEAGLEVCVRVPTAAGGGYYDTMVCIGHNDTETKLLNPNNPFGEPFGRGAMLTDAAYEAVARGIGLDDAYTDGEGTQYSLNAESMEVIGIDEQFEPAYVFKADTNEGNHISTAGWYAVGVFSGTLWEMDITSGEWASLMNGTGLLPEELYTGANASDALAVVWNEPGEYECWAAAPCSEVDLIACGSDTNHYISDGETLLLFAVEDGTLVSFDAGTMKRDGFAAQSRLWSLKLNAGDSVLVYVIRPEGMPTQAITVSTESDAGTYILQYTGIAGTPEFEYVTSASGAR